MLRKHTNKGGNYVLDWFNLPAEVNADEVFYG